MEIVVLIAILAVDILNFLDRRGLLGWRHAPYEKEESLQRKEKRVEIPLYKKTREVRKAGDS